MIKTEIIADSLNPSGVRLTTFILEYPRFIHSEIMTHRMMSKNAASSRAIPTSKIIQNIMDNPAMPVWWGKNQSGMQAKEELDNTNKDQVIPYGKYVRGFKMGSSQERAKYLWLEARDNAIETATQLLDIGLHKQIANRILEPWFNMKIILSGTEFGNFFALRAHPDAQPEFQELAYKMLENYNTSVPKQLKEGEWHIPFGDNIDEGRVWNYVNSLERHRIDKPAEVYYGTNSCELEDCKRKIAIARCARISYFNFEGKDDYEKDIELCDRLFGSIPRHLSPTEHVAQAINGNEFIGNFRGFKQYRKFFEDENLNDERILKK